MKLVESIRPCRDHVLKTTKKPLNFFTSVLFLPNPDAEAVHDMGGSRGGQNGHATHVKNAQVINVQS